MSQSLFEKHRPTLEAAVDAIASRGYWAAYAEMPSPKVYGETAMDDGKRACESCLGQQFALDQPGQTGWMDSERSPYGPRLKVSYPVCDARALIDAG
ncbi:MAG TPA: phenylacetic acid degradation protein PaaN, partial [Rhodocyclaceae bacterium]|nr:phenylacetic acid degradation protein PaaN [Rhodocyclaceae bacterium]